MRTLLRTLLRKIILWALAGAAAPQYEPAELDRIAAGEKAKG